MLSAIMALLLLSGQAKPLDLPWPPFHTPDYLHQAQALKGVEDLAYRRFNKPCRITWIIELSSPSSWAAGWIVRQLAQNWEVRVSLAWGYFPFSVGWVEITAATLDGQRAVIWWQDDLVGICEVTMERQRF